MREFITCPNCSKSVTFPEGTGAEGASGTLEACPKCGFPLVGDMEPSPSGVKSTMSRRRRMARWIVLLFIVAFGVTETFYFLYKSYSDEYFGFTTHVADTIKPLSESDASWVDIRGDELFRNRTLLTLSVMKERTPQYYDLVSASIKGVEEIRGGKTLKVDGHTLHLTGIGAMVDSFSGQMWIKTRMAFGSNPVATYDWSVFNYAATLIHESMHVEIMRQGIALDTVAEEVECEKAALDFLRRAGGPQVLISGKETYIKYPNSPQYRKWYNWYHQFTSGAGNQ